MTVEQLAAAICKSKSCVSKYETGQIAVDLPALYDIAAALDVRVTQLLYLPPVASSTAPFGVVPAFFAGLSQFFLYYYDGRSNQITRCVVDIINENERGVYRVQMFMNVKDYNRYHLCENVYYGTMTHYNTLTMLVLQNQNMEMDHYQVGIPSRPLMPTSTKVLLSKNIQEETAEFEKDLRFSKEDIRLMKLYNMLTIL